MVNRRRRRIGRWLAPVALITCAVAVYAVVDNTLLKDDSASSGNGSTQQTTSTKSTSKKGAKARKRRRAYVVKSGRHPLGDLDQDRRLAAHRSSG
jgi:hypothetical protein